MRTRSIFVLAIIVAAAIAPLGIAAAKHVKILNVSYDPTRELYKEVNERFAAKWKERIGDDLVIEQSHGGSGSQARAVVDGLEADVVTLALWPDTDAIRKKGLISNGWDGQLPHHASAYLSTIVFLVRKGNPREIKDWPDLVKPGVEIVTPNPKTSGNGKLSFLAAWGAITQKGGTEEEAKDFVTKLYRQAPVLDTGARGSTVTFTRKGVGDVQLTWENEAHLAVKEFPGKFEILYPSISFLAEPPLAVVDVNARRHGTSGVAKAYLEYLYTPEAQEIAARNFYRPTDPAVAAKYAATFPAIRFFKIDAVAKDWDDAYQKYFGTGGVFDQIYAGAN
jgi:sulfate/thiosulfate transport system substrate-binding protein